MDANGFWKENHYKVGANDTGRAGVYVAGCSQGARDIADTVAHAAAAASKVQSFLAQRRSRAA